MGAFEAFLAAQSTPVGKRVLQTMHVLLMICSKLLQA
jgi:hypothetical protein